MPQLSLPFVGDWNSHPLLQGWGPSALSWEPPLFGYGHFHAGLDFGMPPGTTILAAAAGTVVVAGLAENNGYFGFGVMIALDHGDGMTTIYGHCQQALVGASQTVARGQPIALSDTTGNAGHTPHLHFQVDQGLGYHPVEPTQYLSGVAATATYDPTSNPLGLSSPSAGAPVGASGGGVLSYSDVIYYARGAGIPDGQLATCAAIAMAESSRDPLNINTKNSDGSIDRGLWQINSVHCQPKGPYNAQALFDPAYNAAAMAAIYRAKGNWSDWSTYTTTVAKLSYRQYLSDAQAAVAATPPGYTPSVGASVASADGSSAGVATTPADTSAQLPVIKITVAPMTPRLDLFHSVADRFGAALVWIDGHYIFPQALTFTASEFYAPSQFDATLYGGHLNAAVRAALKAKDFTQIIIYGGFVDTLPAVVDQLLPLWTGVVEGPTIDIEKATHALSGPDYSGVLSDNNATSSALDQFANQTGAQIVTSLVAAHNRPGQPGLTVRADSSVLQGQAFGSDVLKTRQSGTTEWDIATQMAQDETKTLYWEGTALVYIDLPPEGHPLYLNYRVAGEPSLISNPVVTYQKHAKRDYQTEVVSYDRTTGHKVGPAIGGNHDATTVAGDTLPPGSSQQACQRRADWLANVLAATEYTLTFTVEGIVPLARGQAVIIVSDDEEMALYNGQKWYPTERKFAFSADATGTTGGGWSMQLTCTNRPYTVSRTVSAATAATSGGAGP